MARRPAGGRREARPRRRRAARMTAVARARTRPGKRRGPRSIGVRCARRPWRRPRRTGSGCSAARPTSAGMPSAMASMATVEFTVTTRSRDREQRARSSARRGHAHAARRRSRRGFVDGAAVSAGCGLISSAAPGVAFDRGDQQRQPAPDLRALRDHDRDARRSPRPARARGRARAASSIARRPAASRSSAGLPVTRSAAGGKMPRLHRVALPA